MILGQPTVAKGSSNISDPSSFPSRPEMYRHYARWIDDASKENERRHFRCIEDASNENERRLKSFLGSDPFRKD